MTAGFALHLLRHGAPLTPGLLLGHTDAPPAPAGLAACVARAQGLAVGRLISSDLQRCRQPGAAIGAALGLECQADARWRELDFGAWDGLDPAAIAPEALAAFHADPALCPPPGGEAWPALVARIGAALADLAPCDTLVVTHGGAMRAALAALCGLDARQVWAVDLPYAALLSLRVWPGAGAGGAPWAQITGLAA